MKIISNPFDNGNWPQPVTNRDPVLEEIQHVNYFDAFAIHRDKIRNPMRLTVLENKGGKAVYVQVIVGNPYRHQVTGWSSKTRKNKGISAIRAALESAGFVVDGDIGGPGESIGDVMEMVVRHVGFTSDILVR